VKVVGLKEFNILRDSQSFYDESCYEIVEVNFLFIYFLFCKIMVEH